MTEVEYTHDFKIKVGDTNFEGEMEFNVDGQASWKPDEGIALSASQQECLTRFLAELKRMFDIFGSIKKIKVEEK